MKWLLIILGVIACLIIIVVIIGYSLPVKHVATVQMEVKAAPEAVWQRLINYKDYPLWRKDVKSVTPVSEAEWIETDKHNNKLPLKITTATAPHRLVTQINSKGLPFGGSWEFTLQPGNNGTLITITEHGEVYNPVFRFISRYLMGHTSTIRKYSAYLQQSF